VCHEAKPITEFRRHYKTADGRFGLCSACLIKRIARNRRAARRKEAETKKAEVKEMPVGEQAREPEAAEWPLKEAEAPVEHGMEGSSPAIQEHLISEVEKLGDFSPTMKALVDEIRHKVVQEMVGVIECHFHAHD